MVQKTKNANVSVPSDFMATVDIIIPFRGQYEKVTKLIESIYRLTRTNYFTICLVDDGSPNQDYIGTVARNVERSAARRRVRNNLKVIRCEEPKGFGGALRTGYDNTDNPYVCFMNSDCLVEDANWLRAMGESLLKLKADNVRMISAMTDNIVGGDPAQAGERTTRSPDDVILGDDSHLSLYCVLAHRELFPRCKGFIKEYPYGYFEDEEWAARMRHYGYKQAVCRKSWVAHEGMSTITPLWRADPSIQTIMQDENRKRCISDLQKLS